MAQQRKLQMEIDRVLKKVAEGVEIFEDIWEKSQATTNQSQKDKFELEMKKEIKKLQRLRDQLKNWQASNEVKDKEALIESRRNIENLMERFKVVEKESKTKAYSKEGLGATLKLDPQEKEKEDARAWISEAIEKIKQNIDLLEGESEAINAKMAKKKRKDDKQSANRLSELSDLIGRHTQHMEALERALRLVDNVAIDMKRIAQLHDDVDLYLNEGPDHDYEDDDLLCQEVSGDEEMLPANASITDARSGRQSESDDYSQSELTRTSQPTKHRILSHPALTSTPPKPRASTGQYFAKASPARQTSASEATSMGIISSADTKGYSGVHGMSTSLQSLSQTSDKSQIAWKGVEQTRRSTDCVVKEIESSHSWIPTRKDRSESSTASQMRIDTELSEIVVQESESPIPDPDNDRYKAEESEFTETIEDKLDDEISEARKIERKSLVSAAMFSYAQLPSMYNHDFNRSPVGFIPTRYPNRALDFSDPVVEKYEQFVEMSTATLFFIFYHQEGTSAQFFAAKVLKSRSWRFHTELNMWFQRHEEPASLCEEYEEGDYIYFDHQAWVQKRWNNFRFDYRSLEDKEF